MFNREAREILLREAETYFRKKSDVKIVVMPGTKPSTTRYQGTEGEMAMDSEQYAPSPASTSRTHDDDETLSDATEMTLKSSDVSDALEIQEACTPGAIKDAESISEDQLVPNLSEQGDMNSTNIETEENFQCDSVGNSVDSKSLSYPMLSSQRPRSRRGEPLE